MTDAPRPWALNAWDAGVYAIPGLPLIQKGDDLARVIHERATQYGFSFAEGDVLVVASKVVSKAEGMVVRLADVTPSADAHGLARATGRDPRLCELVIRESAEIYGTSGRMIITRHRLGFHCTNAGVDRSNISLGSEEAAITLPRDPDASARAIRAGLRALSDCSVAVIITDSFGLPDRAGAIGLAIGLAGIRHMEERESHDLYGAPRPSALMLVDALAATATLLMGETDEGQPAVVIRGVSYTQDEAASINGLLVPYGRTELLGR
jgi:coenzyme F420-0:L-glutamate ligase/coenzyme F420-1:gamma-L-glutamate ligase